MEVKTKSSQLETNAQGEKQKFKIDSNAKAFEILTNTLYKDVKSSIVRELISNGHDGHVRKGNLETPIKVHSPTVLEPFFEVRDFGCSMDEHTINHIYTSFFSSTKNDNNEEVGGFGLGCKLPFAYTDVFTVATYLKGKKQEYIASKEDGFPMLMKAGEAEDTTEPDGVQVTVPVNEEDCEIFEAEIKKFIKFSHFNIDAGFDDVQKPVELDNCGIEDYHNFVGSTLVNVGGVPYSVDINALCMSDNDYGYLDNVYRVAFNDSGKRSDLFKECVLQALDNLQMELTNNSTFGYKNQVNLGAMSLHKIVGFQGMLDFDVGELDITASRESLQYSDKTIKAIVTKAMTVAFKATDKCTKAIYDHNNGKDLSYPHFKQVAKIIEPFMWLEIRRQNNDSLRLKINETENKCFLYTNCNVLVFDKQFVKDNDIDDILVKPKWHSVEHDDKVHHVNYSDSVRLFNDDQCHIFVTNALLKYCTNIRMTEDDKERNREAYHSLIVVTVDRKSDVKKQAAALQERLDEWAKGLFKVHFVDKEEVEPDDVLRPTAKKVVLDENGDKPMDAMAKRFIEKEKEIIARFGKLYYYSGDVPNTDIDMILSLSANAEVLGIPDLSILVNSRDNKHEDFCHGRAFAMLSKYTDVPCVDLSKSENRECCYKGKRESEYLRVELFHRLRNECKRILLQNEINSSLKSIVSTLISQGFYVSLSLRKLLPFKNLHFRRYHSLNDWNMDETVANTVLCRLLKKYFMSVPAEQRYKMLAITLYQNGHAYMFDEEMKKMLF